MRVLLLVFCTLFPVSSSASAGDIHDAAGKGDVAGIVAALDAGASVDEVARGVTPLLVAVRGGHLDAARLLIERGADVNAAPTPLLGPPLLPALTKRRVDLIDLLLGAGADPNWRGAREAVVHAAVRTDCLPCVMALVEAGADVNARTAERKTPLHLARQRGQADIAAYLVSRGIHAPVPDPISPQLASADVSKGQAVFSRLCKSCHSIQPEGGRGTGPTLWGVVGRDRASVAGQRYSDALSGWAGDWTLEDLNRFLSDPMLAVPGVLMEVPGVTDAAERTDLIAYLRTLGDTPVPLP